MDTSSAIVRVFAEMVLDGRKDIKEVPKNIRNAVNEVVKEADAGAEEDE